MANLSSPLFSLSAAVSWGAGDFSGGMATRRSTVFSVVAVAHAVGLAFMVALALLFREKLPGGFALAWGLAAGLVGGAGLAGLYRALAVGKMGLNAPLSAVIAVLVPLVFSLFHEGLPHALRLGGFSVALLSIWLIATQGREESAVQRPVGSQFSENQYSAFDTKLSAASSQLSAGTPQQLSATTSVAKNSGLGLAIAAGVGLGGFLLLIKFAGSSAVFWPVVASRVGSLGLMLTVLAASGGRWRPTSGSLPWVLMAGLLDTGANALYVVAEQRGSLAVAAVLSSLYPASTVILARLVLKERWSRLQGVGMAAALLAVGMISY